MKKLYRINVIINLCLLPAQLVSLPSKTSNLWERLKVNTQGLTENLRRVWYGAGEAQVSRPPRTQQSYFRNYAQGIRQLPGAQKSYGYAQQTKQFIKRRPLLTAVGATVGIAIMIEAQDIADIAHKAFAIDTFDEELMFKKFSQAIVRIYNTKDTSTKTSRQVKDQSTAFIVRSEQNPDHYFALTAAHCVKDQELQIVEINDPRNLRIKIVLDTVLLIADYTNDIAVLLIPAAEVKRFEENTGSMLPAILAKQLSGVKPHHDEVIELQGYPGFISRDEPIIYRHKLMVHKGPPTWPVNGREEFFSWNMEKSLSGASGGPLIALQDKEPRVVGISSLQSRYKYPRSKLLKPGEVLGAGVEKLPHYLQEAESIATNGTAEQEQRVKETLIWLEELREHEKKNKKWWWY